MLQSCISRREAITHHEPCRGEMSKLENICWLCYPQLQPSTRLGSAPCAIVRKHAACSS